MSDPNDEAVARIASTVPTLTDMVTARDAVRLGRHELGHAGPPFDAGEVPSPVVLNALAGATVHEGWAATLERAREMVRCGDILLRPNHDLGIASPMGGVVRPSQTLFRVEDPASGAVAFATLAEKGRQVLRFGQYGPEIAESLRFVEGEVASAIATALPKDGLPLLPLIEQAVALGDDVHQRNVGGMLSFLAALPALDPVVRGWLSTHPQHFLNYAMAAAKLGLDRASGMPGSTVVTAITRNGIQCGIRLSGTGDRWFRAPATVPRGGFFPGFTLDDAHLDLGDSAIMETFGLGGCIAHTAPEIARTMQRDWPEATAAGLRMRKLFVAASPTFKPALAVPDGVGIGLDARLVAQAGTGVRIHTGIAHKDGQSGWIGIGVAEAPHACFAAAVAAVDREAPAHVAETIT